MFKCIYVFSCVLGIRIPIQPLHASVCFGHPCSYLASACIRIYVLDTRIPIYLASSCIIMFWTSVFLFMYQYVLDIRAPICPFGHPYSLFMHQYVLDTRVPIYLASSCISMFWTSVFLYI